MSSDNSEYSSTSVWIADPDPSICWVLEKALQKAKLSTRTFTHAAELLKALEKVKPNIILLDILFSEIDGNRFIEKVQSIRPNLPIVALTADPRLSEILPNQSKGIYECLPKPFDINNLIETVHQICSLIANNNLSFEESQSIENSWQNHLREWVRSSLDQGDKNLFESATLELEYILLEETLKFTGGKKQLASKILGLGRNTLSRKAKNFNINN
tara:strand:+ start:22129 stop:22773 length:645 start_codon:yes stop_codon:yes gene_type:complete